MISLSKIPYIHRIYMVLANPTYQTCLALEKLTSVPCDNSILCCIYLLFTNYQVQFKFPVLNGSKFTNYQVQFSVPVLNSSKARMYCSTSHEQPCHDVQAILSRRAGNPVTTCSCHDVPAFLSQRAGNPVTTCREPCHDVPAILSQRASVTVTTCRQPCHDVQATLSRRAGNPVTTCRQPCRAKRNITRVDPSRTCMVFMRYFWQGNNQIYGHILCTYKDLATLNICTHIIL
jgi:hypothetical protein